MTPDQRAKILDMLCRGHALEGAAAMAGVKVSEVRRDHGLMLEVVDAFATGTAKLNAKLLEQALAGAGGHGMLVIERELERRDRVLADLRAQAGLAEQKTETDEELEARLKQLSEDELFLFKWLHDGIGEKPQVRVKWRSVPRAKGYGEEQQYCRKCAAAMAGGAAAAGDRPTVAPNVVRMPAAARSIASPLMRG